MSNKAMKTLIKWGLIIVLFGFIIENLSTTLPLLAIALVAFIAVKKLKKKTFRK